jgi:hypothetical protein
MNLSMSNYALCAGGILVLILLWKWQRSHPDFDLADLITGDNGRVSATKAAQFGAWMVATWGFITLIQQGKMSEWYMAAYMGLSFGARTMKDVFGKPTEPPK